MTQEVTITSRDANRYRDQSKLRGDMVIELAKELEYQKGTPAAKLIRIAREIVEARYRERS